MTYREYMMIHNPECVNEKYYGGVSGCPHWFGLCSPNDGICNCEDEYAQETGMDKTCRICWWREMPPKKVKIKPIPRNGNVYDMPRGCVYCEKYGVKNVMPIGNIDGLGYVKARYCFNCGRKLK